MALNFPWNVADKYAYETEYRKLFVNETGVVGDLTGDGLRLTATGSSRTVTLSPGEMKIHGFHRVLETADTRAFDAATTGTQPAAGQHRIALLVARLDMTGKQITFVLLTGAPVATASTPARPTLNRSLTGLHDVPLWSWRDTPNAVSNSMLEDERQWLGRVTVGVEGFVPRADVPIGSVVWAGEKRYRRMLVNGAAAWSTGTARTTFPLPADWLGGGDNGKQLPQLYKTDAGLVHLSGRIYPTTGQAATTGRSLPSIPAAYRAATARGVLQFLILGKMGTYTGPVRLDVNPATGAMSIHKPDLSAYSWAQGDAWFSFAGVSWPTD